MIDIHQNLIVWCRLFCAKGRVQLITAVKYSSCMFLFLFFHQMITAPGLLAFLQTSVFLCVCVCFFFNFTQSGPFLFS